MKNSDIFSEFAIRILKDLFEAFPTSARFPKDQYLGAVLSLPENPVTNDHWGKGIYVGPDMSWALGPNAKATEWARFDWTSCLKEAEEAIGRPLTDEELRKLNADGVRPYTDEERRLVSDWKAEVAVYTETREQQETKESILIGTLQFLVNEGFVRIIDRAHRPGQALQPVDVAIERNLEALRFSLTSKGFIHLNRRGPLASGSFYDAIKSYVADKSVDAFAGAAAASILSPFLNG